LKPYRPGDFLTSWSITTGLPTRRSRFIVDLPANVKPRLIERNLRNPAKITKDKATIYVAMAERMGVEHIPCCSARAGKCSARFPP
jgi:hypothetical protein